MASVLKLNRNAATLLAVYDPVGTGVNAAQNVDSWNCQGKVGNNSRISAEKSEFSTEISAYCMWISPVGRALSIWAI